ncbi:carbohydrate ABC transporter permease [Cohnella cellulosilytica]|uniref:carbohydrate ABC transporter permease n=1 Tax=Cohnella cellulosilytica TaxID=986710 RepID=UPI0035EFDC44
MKSKNALFYGLLFIAPAFLVYTLIRIIPLSMSFLYSFTNWDGFSPTYSFVGFRNYAALTSNHAIIQTIKNTLVFAVANVALITLLAIPIAIALNSRLKTRNLLRAVFFFPSVPSVLIIGYVWLFILNPSSSGIMNQLLLQLGLAKVSWLSDYDMAMVSLIMVSVWRLTGWHCCIYIANLQSIPKDYYEAAMIDGANGWQRFRAITFPMLAPSMTISMLLITIDSLKVFELPFALTKGGPGSATTLMTQLIIEKGINDHLVGQSSAFSIVFILFIFVVAVFQLKMMRRREERLDG